MKNQKGFALVLALVVTALLLALGSTALLMSQLGYYRVASEKNFQRANWAAEYAVNSGVLYAINNNACPPSTGPTALTGGASYSYFSVNASNFCFIKGTGTINGATVVKTVVVPSRSTPTYGAVTMRDGGTVTLNGSAAISSCDPSCATPGVVYGGTLSQTINGGLHNTSSCPNNPKGVYGSPYASENQNGISCTQTAGPPPICTAAALPDQVPAFFNSSSWSALQSSLSATAHNGLTVSVSTLNVTNGLPTIGSVPSPSCVCTDTNFTLTSSTSLSCTGVTHLTSSNCPSGVKFPNIASNKTLAISGVPSGMTIVVSGGPVSITGSLSGVTIYATSAGGMTIGSGGSITNTKLVSAGGISSAGTISSSNVITNTSSANIAITGGTVTNSIFLANGGSSSINVSGGNLTTSSLVTTSTSGNVPLSNGCTLTGCLVVSPGTFTQDGGAVLNTNVFAGYVTIDKGAGDIAGGILYSQFDTNSTGTGGGSQQVGTSANPTLVLAGTNITLAHNGNMSFNGLFFCNGSFSDAGSTGNYSINGAVVSNSATTTDTVTISGNASSISAIPYCLLSQQS